MYNELKRVRHDLEVSREQNEDLSEELREMTQLYLLAKQERDKYKLSLENIKKDVDQMDKIIKDNVDRAIKAREKQFQEVQIRLKES